MELWGSCVYKRFHFWIWREKAELSVLEQVLRNSAQGLSVCIDIRLLYAENDKEEAVQ